MPMHLQEALNTLRQHFLAFSSLVEASVADAIRAIAERDTALAQRVVERDDLIDRTEVEIEEECLKILVLHQPVAGDMRLVVGVLKINSDLERIGDKAVNIAERVAILARQPEHDMPIHLQEMSGKARAMLKKVLDALTTMDPALAQEVCAADAEIDRIHRENYARIREAILHHPEQVATLMHFVLISRNLERIGDHATNIAEDILYILTGEIVRHRHSADQ